MSLPTSVIYMDLPVRASHCHHASFLSSIAWPCMTLGPIHRTLTLTYLQGYVANSTTCRSICTVSMHA